MVSCGVVVVSALVLLLSYNVYNEFVPPGSANPAKLKLMFSVRTLIDNGMYILSRTGLVDYVYMKRGGAEMGLRHANRAMEGVETEDDTIEGVPVRMYRPTGLSATTPGPAMVYYHGGGWTIGSINTHNAMTSYFAKKVDMFVISVDYRLSPEYSQKDGLDDCVTVTRHLINTADTYGVDPRRVVVAGDSAGGNYAAAVSLVLRDEGFTPMPKTQLLIYPTVQAIDLMLPSYQQNADGPLLTRFEKNWFLSQTHAKSVEFMPYFNNNTHVPSDVRIAMATSILDHDSDVFPKENKYAPYEPPNYNSGKSDIWDKIKENFLDPYHFPQMAKDHYDLPAAYILTCQYDMLRDEGYLYAGTLRKSGVDVTHYNSPVGWHGMLNLVQDLTDAADIMDKMCYYLRQKL